MKRLAAATVAALMVAGAGSPALAQSSASGAKCTTKAVMDAFVPLFYEKRDVRTAFETWVAPDYIQHNPVAKDGRDNAIAALEPFFKAMPGMSYTVARVIIEGDLAVVHNKLKMNAADRGSAVIDIFRIKDCKIVEHWDVMQAIPEKSANDHPMF